MALPEGYGQILPRDALSDTLAERRTQHGDFKDQFKAAQKLKGILNDANWETADKTLDPIMQEALDQICHKLSRIVVGDPNHADHWRDIAGYATLICNMLEDK